MEGLRIHAHASRIHSFAGRSGVDRLLMGSVAERVMRDAPCSVMVVKLPRARLPDPAFAAG